MGTLLSTNPAPGGAPSNFFKFGDGQQAGFNLTVTSMDLGRDMLQAQVDILHSYPSPNNNGQPWQGTFQNGARLATLLNSADKYFALKTTVDLVAHSSSPTATQVPIVGVNTYPGALVSTTPLGASASSGMPLSYRLGTPLEMCGGNSGCTQPPAFSINPSTGVISWNTTNLPVGLYCTLIFVTEGKAVVTVDFLLNLTRTSGYCTSCTNFPTCTQNSQCASSCGTSSTCQLQRNPVFVTPTPPTTQEIVVNMGTEVRFWVKAESADGNAVVVTITNSGAPSASTISDINNGTNPTTHMFSWPTTAQNVGRRVVCFSAVSTLQNSNGAKAESDPHCITIVVNEVCIRKTCAEQNIFCGNFSDGCNSTLSCGDKCNDMVIMNGPNALTASSVTGALNSAAVTSPFNSATGPSVQQKWIFDQTDNINNIVYGGNQKMILCKNPQNSQLVLLDQSTSGATINCKWAISKSGENRQFMLTNLVGPRVMDVEGNRREDGTRNIVYMQKTKIVENQLFYAWAASATEAVAPGAMYIKSYPMGYYLTVDKEAAVGVGAVIENSPRGTDLAMIRSRQQWIITHGTTISLASNPDLVIGTNGFVQQLFSKASLGASVASHYWAWVPSPKQWSTTFSFVFQNPGAPVATASNNSTATNIVSVLPQNSPALPTQIWTVQFL